MGRALQRRREEFLAEARTARTILILGDGDGRFLERLCGSDLPAIVHCVDSSVEMLAAARARVNRRAAGNGQPIAFHHADARQWLPPEGTVYDLIVTHFFLDCFEEAEVSRIIRRYTGMLRPGGRWIVSEFRVPPSSWAAWRARVWIGSLYRLFGWLTGLRVRALPRYRPALKAAGLQLERCVTADAGMLVSELWEKHAAPPSADDCEQQRGQ